MIKTICQADFLIVLELWGIVNNAGIINNLSWIELDNLESMKKISDVNLWGMVAVTKIFLPLLKKSKGRIVNVSSVAGRMSGPSAMSYTISKYGVEAFSDSLRLEMKSWDISVHILEPAGFTTRITDKELTISNVAQRWGDLDQPTKENYGEDFLHDGKYLNMHAIFFV